jgi:hypothetical protein
LSKRPPEDMLLSRKRSNDSPADNTSGLNVPLHTPGNAATFTTTQARAGLWHTLEKTFVSNSLSWTMNMIIIDYRTCRTAHKKGKTIRKFKIQNMRSMQETLIIE